MSWKDLFLYDSVVLGRKTETILLMPDHLSETKAEVLPCLWLLHGYDGTCYDWSEHTSIETLAEKENMIFVCPEGENFYADSDEGGHWQTFLMEELWDKLHEKYRYLTSEKGKNGIAGNSMGGYGAMRFALKYPDKFGFCASLSGGLNMPQRFAGGENFSGKMQICFGNSEYVVESEHDLVAAARKLAASQGCLPEIFLCCGRKDWEYVPNREYRELLTGLGYPVTWEEADFGHEWAFWSEEISRIVKAFLSSCQETSEG